MQNKPNPTLAGALCLISPPLGMLYAARGAWAAVYLLAFLGAVALMFLHPVTIVGLVLVLALCVTSVMHAYRLASAYPAERTRPHYSRWYGVLGIFLGAAFVIVGLRTFLFEPFRTPSGSMVPTLEFGSVFFVQKWGYGHYDSFGITLSRRPISAELQRGDIIAFDRLFDGVAIQFVERLVGLPGDTIAYRDKKLSINGREVPQVREGDYRLVSPAQDVRYLTRFAESLDGGPSYSVLIREDAPWAHTEAGFGFVRQEGCTYDEHGETCKIPPGHYFVMGDNRDNSNDSRYWGFVPAERIVGRVVQVF